MCPSSPKLWHERIATESESEKREGNKPTSVNEGIRALQDECLITHTREERWVGCKRQVEKSGVGGATVMSTLEGDNSGASLEGSV